MNLRWRTVADTPEQLARKRFDALLASGQVEMGRMSYDRPTVLTWPRSTEGAFDGRLRVGAFCSISEGVTVALGGEHHAEWMTTYPMRIKYHLPGAEFDGHPWSRGDVVIGNDVWIQNS